MIHITGNFELQDNDLFPPYNIVSLNVTWTVNWGDGTTSNFAGAIFSASPHTYASVGTYTITITATDGIKSASRTYIHALPSLTGGSCVVVNKTKGWVWKYSNDGNVALRMFLDARGEDAGFIVGYDRMEATAESYKKINGTFKYRKVDWLEAHCESTSGCFNFNFTNGSANAKCKVGGDRNFCSWGNGLPWQDVLGSYTLTQGASGTINHNLNLNSCN